MPPSSIFRTEALHRHRQRQGQVVLPRFVSPPTFICLWLLLGLFMLSGVLMWFIQVPVYGSGTAVVVSTSDYDLPDDVGMLLLFPADMRSELQVGQTIFAQTEALPKNTSWEISVIMPYVMSPQALFTQFELGSGTALMVDQPVVVALAPFRPDSPTLLPRHYLGAVYPVRVEVGSQQVITLLPVVGSFFAGDSS